MIDQFDCQALQTIQYALGGPTPEHPVHASRSGQDSYVSKAAPWLVGELPQAHASESGLSLNARQDYCVSMGKAMVARLMLLQPLDTYFFRLALISFVNPENRKEIIALDAYINTKLGWSLI